MSVIVITGNPRSGTSMMMRILEAGGVPCLYNQRFDEYNKDGYYEHHAAMAGDFSAVPDGFAVKCLQNLAISPAADIKAIIMRRDLRASLASFNNAVTGKGIGRGYPKEHLNMMQGCIDSIRLWCADKPHIEIWYEDMLRNSANECLRIRAFLDLDLDLAAMSKVVRHA